MKRMLHVFGLVLGLSLGCSASVMAETLTGDLVSSWLKSQKEVEAFGDKYESRLDPYDANIDEQASMEDAFKQGIVALKKTGLYGEFENIVEGYGFDSPEQWSQIGTQIMMAYMSVEMAQQAPQMEQMMAQMDAMMQSDQMPADQKEMMMNAMKQSQQMYQSSKNVPQADMEAIKPYLPQLRAMGEETESSMP